MTKNITFTLPAEAVEGATEAFLLGDFNNWNPEKAIKLEKTKDGSFKAIVQLEEGKTYHYRFLLNDGRWVNDYNAQKYESIPGFFIDNCVITVAVSKVEDAKKAQPVKAIAADKKAVKAEPAAKVEPVVAKAAKKVAPKAVKAKSVDAKVQSPKVEKPPKAIKKASPKAKK